MKHFLLYLAFFLALFIYDHAKADTYPAIILYSHTGPTDSDTNGQALCDRWKVTWGAASSTFDQVGGRCLFYNSGGYSMGAGGLSISKTCPSGGSVSGNDCINAPACLSPQTRKTIPPYSCFTPIECKYPETDNGSGHCANNTCPVGQNRNPCTNQCQTPPVCGSAEFYSICENTCKLYPLQCPGHSHANSTNDGCLPDPPLICPQGQHDDGTYNCVADDAKGCSGGYISGYVNNILTCVKKPNHEDDKKLADDKKKAAQDAQIAANNAAQAAIDANNALAADPTNTAKQEAAEQANNNAQALQHKADNANAEAAQAAANAQINELDSINRNTGDLINGKGKSLTAVNASSFDDAIPTGEVENAKSAYETAFSTIQGQVQSLFSFSGSGSGSLPVFDMGTYYNYHVVVDLNQYATPLSYVGYTFMFFAVFIAVRILLG